MPPPEAERRADALPVTADKDQVQPLPEAVDQSESSGAQETEMLVQRLDVVAAYWGLARECTLELLAEGRPLNAVTRERANENAQPLTL